MLINNTDDLKESIHLRFSGLSFNGLKYLIIGREPTTKNTADFIKKCLDEVLESGAEISVHREGRWTEIPVDKYSVEIYDVKNNPEWGSLFLEKCIEFKMPPRRYLYQIMRQIKDQKEEGKIFIPIFHNAHYAKENPNILARHWADFVTASFDAGAPDILSINKPALRDLRSPSEGSRLSCYEQIFVTSEFFKSKKVARL